MKRTVMRITLTVGLVLAACQGDDVSLGDDSDGDGDGDPIGLCGGAMDAEGYSDPDDPTCQPDQGLGVKWDGIECIGIAGCECVGDDCDNLFANVEECQGACVPTCNSTDTTDPCPQGTYCFARDPNGGAFTCGAGYCYPPPDDCTGFESGPVCGCDGVTYETICAAMQAGVAPGGGNTACE